MQPGMPGTDADRQQGLVRRLCPAAMSAAVRVGVEMTRVEELSDEVVVGDAFRFGAGEAADLDDAGDLHLERLALGR
jgi:hypothetical protein